MEHVGAFLRTHLPTSKIIRKVARPLRSHLDVGCLIPSLSRPGVGRDQAHPQEYQEAQHNQTCSRALLNNINILSKFIKLPACQPTILSATDHLLCHTGHLRPLYIFRASRVNNQHNRPRLIT